MPTTILSFLVATTALAASFAFSSSPAFASPPGSAIGRAALMTEQQRQARVKMAELGKSLDLFYMDCGRYPSTEDGLSSLQVDPHTCRRNWGPDPYVKSIPNDPWGRPYVYAAGPDEQTYELKTLGADGREGGTGEDMDIVN